MKFEAIQQVLTAGPGASGKSLSAGFCQVEKKRNVIENFPHFRLLFLIKGTGSYSIDSQVQYPLTPGTLIYRHPGRKEIVVRDNPAEWWEFFLWVSGEHYKCMLKLGVLNEAKTAAQIGIDSITLNRLKNFIDIIGNIRDEYSSSRLFSEIFALLAFFQEREGYGTDDSQLNQSIEDAKFQLSMNLNEKLQLPQLARGLGLSYDAFRKKFRDKLGVSPKEYRIRKKIEKAQELLRDPIPSIEEISHELGYTDLFAFSKQFKKKTGLSPTSFRRTSM